MTKHTMTYEYVSTNARLQEITDLLLYEDTIAVDTEFVRRDTYFPKFGLLQIAASLGRVYLIDPLMCDVSFIHPVFQNTTVLKIFHAPAQDLEVFLCHGLELPQPLFDLQYAAFLLGHQKQKSLNHLTCHYLNRPLNKKIATENWMKRPLKETMLQYACDDAQSIYDLYPHLILTQTLREQHDRVMNDFFDAVRFPDPIQKMMMKAKSLLRTPKHEHLFKQMILWRENLARKINKPREHVVKQQTLLDLLFKKTEDFDDFLILLTQQSNDFLLKNRACCIELWDLVSHDM